VLVVCAAVLAPRDRVRALLRFVLGTMLATPVLLVQAWAFRGVTGGDAWRATVLPFVQQVTGGQSSPYLWLYRQPMLYFARDLVTWTPIALLAPVGIAAAVVAAWRRRPGWREDVVLATLALLPFVYLVASARKEHRYLVLAAPWLAIAIIAGLRAVFARIAPSGRVAAAVVLVLAAVTAPGLPARLEPEVQLPKPYYDHFLGALAHVPPGTTILTATPMLRSDGHVVVGYYDIASFHDVVLRRRFDYVCYTPWAFPCADGDDACEELQARTLAWLGRHYDVYRVARDADGEPNWLFRARR